MHEANKSAQIARRAFTGAILGSLCAIAANLLGVQQLLRRPDLILYIPAAIVGAVLGATRLRPLLWIATGIVALLCIIISYTPLVVRMSRDFVRRDPPPARADAIAVLSSGFTSDGMMRSETLDRLLTGLKLGKRGAAAAMLVSTEQRSIDGKVVSDSADLQAVVGLVGLSIPIFFVDSVLTTRTEALRMKALAQQHGWTTLIVVTSPMHSKRACATFEAVGFKVACRPAEVRQSGLYESANAEDRLRAFRAWLYETFATDSYRRRGWIR
ncbi:MAG: YdcF family protein [Gemmatimonadaceae bacterium]